jgi:hypothetical protein
VGFVGFISPFYYLGEANFVDLGKNVHLRFWLSLLFTISLA